ncbi:MAG: methyltransferase family protein [Candidatus Odinarchaeota archaeon]
MSNGIFNLIRHPVYLAYCLYFISFFLIFPSLLTLISLSGIIGYYKTASFEEKGMIDRIGESYMDYIKSSGKFMPKITKLK